MAELGDRVVTGRRSPGSCWSSYVGLDYYQLTFLVINAFAAAMLGRLRSLPLTFVGAIVLGLGAVGYSQGTCTAASCSDGLQSSLPTLLLFAILIFVPQVRLRVGQIKGILAAPVPSGRGRCGVGVGLLVVGARRLPRCSPPRTPSALGARGHLRDS